ncbi:cation-efflux pump [Geothermobacter hydrogeniphilus]|uniref:Cation-efflux pump n=2 Tax=Geothermobacter hydrogeniphilus TaxID=1969733 RepID=A0A1X0YDZ5_9BACT|nr:cation-efflux pump [Geothermobacter hydrogeniphilus]
MMDTSRLKIRAARISVSTAAGLAAIKLVAGVLTGSLAVLASAVDSLLDILMSGVNYFAIKHAEQPADESHPFGHGKFETAATLIQSTIIALTGAWICFEAVRRLTGEIELARIEGGMIVLLFSVAVSSAISRYLRRTARLTDSSALQADSLHFSMDVYTNLALLLGLILINILKAPWLDPILSMLVGAYIIFEAIKLLRHGMRDMLDEELPESVRAEITRLIESHPDDLIDYHNLRTRRAGSQKIMDFHLTVCRHLTIEQAHDIADALEKRIEDSLPGADVTIHMEPCGSDHCPGHDECEQDKTRLKPRPTA